LVELALILPLLLAISGAAADFATSYQIWLTVESATRNAAEYVATSSCVPAATTCAAAQTDGKRVVCLESQNVPNFTPGPGNNPATCTNPVVTVTWATCNGTSNVVGNVNYCPGGSTTNPIRTARVRVTLAYKTLVPWPLLPHGTATLSADEHYSIVAGR
jgi:Flp pilus assembly protein TadG